MQPKTHYFDGVAFVATPYRAGTYLRKDVLWRHHTRQIVLEAALLILMGAARSLLSA